MVAQAPVSDDFRRLFLLSEFLDPRSRGGLENIMFGYCSPSDHLPLHVLDQAFSHRNGLSLFKATCRAREFRAKATVSQFPTRPELRRGKRMESGRTYQGPRDGSSMTRSARPWARIASGSLLRLPLGTPCAGLAPPIGRGPCKPVEGVKMRRLMGLTDTGQIVCLCLVASEGHQGVFPVFITPPSTTKFPPDRGTEPTLP